MTPSPTILLTVPEAADRLSISRTALYGLIRDGALTSVTIGRSRRIPTTAIDQFVQTLLLSS